MGKTSPSPPQGRGYPLTVSALSILGKEVVAWLNVMGASVLREGFAFNNRLM